MTTRPTSCASFRPELWGTSARTHRRSRFWQPWRGYRPRSAISTARRRRSVRPSGDALQQLTPRDIDILSLLAEGRSLVEIARAIGVSYKTVANHCTQLRTKLAAPRIADLIRFAIANGLSRQDISPEPIAPLGTR